MGRHAAFIPGLTSQSRWPRPIGTSRQPGLNKICWQSSSIAFGKQRSPSAADPSGVHAVAKISAPDYGRCTWTAPAPVVKKEFVSNNSPWNFQLEEMQQQMLVRETIVSRSSRMRGKQPALEAASRMGAKEIADPHASQYDDQIHFPRLLFEEGLHAPQSPCAYASSECPALPLATLACANSRLTG